MRIPEKALNAFAKARVIHKEIANHYFQSQMGRNSRFNLNEARRKEIILAHLKNEMFY